MKTKTPIRRKKLSPIPEKIMYLTTEVLNLNNKVVRNSYNILNEMFKEDLKESRNNLKEINKTIKQLSL